MLLYKPCNGDEFGSKKTFYFLLHQAAERRQFGYFNESIFLEDSIY